MRTRTTAAAAVLLAAGLLLTGCSSSSNDSKSTDEPGVSTTAAINPAGTKTAIDAAAIMTRISAAVPTAHKTVEYTASTDPNGKLGRPHQYTSKIQFSDSRVNQAKAKDESNGDRTDIAYGGAIEVFANDDDAKAWIKYVDSIGKAIGGLVTPDYLLRQGRYVIRASDLLTPSQIDEYKVVLAKLN